MKRILLVTGLILFCFTGSWGQARPKVIVIRDRVQEREEKPVLVQSEKKQNPAWVMPWVNPDDPKVYGLVYVKQSRNKGAKAPTIKMTNSLGRKEVRNPYDIYFESMGKEMDSDPFDALNVDRNDDGPISFTGDFRTMVFAHTGFFRNRSGRKNQRTYGLYFAEFKDGSWQNNTPFEHNERGYWLTSPYISKDGNTLYFTANFKDGQGGFDIYVSRKKNGSWSAPENLGPEINTSENELNPFFHEPSSTLFFSSMGHLKDSRSYNIFRSPQATNGWQAPIMLDDWFNSASNDRQFWLSDNGMEFFISRQSKSRQTNLSLYYAQFVEHGEVIVKEAKPFKPLTRKLTLFDKKLDSIQPELFDYSWELLNKTTGEEVILEGHRVVTYLPDTEYSYEARLRLFDKNLDSLRYGARTLKFSVTPRSQAYIESPDTVFVNQEVIFSGAKSYVGKARADSASYLWIFDENEFEARSSKVEQKVIFTEPGKYTIYLDIKQENEKFKKREHLDRLFSKLHADVESAKRNHYVLNAKTIVVLPKEKAYP